MANPETPRLLFVLTVEPETPQRRWHARLVQHGSASEVAREFDNPLELARYVAQLSLPPPAGGLR
jgi:hypothetical protein